MVVVLYIVCLFSLLAGLVLGVISRKHRTPSAPQMPSFNPLVWFQVWKIPDYFTPRGLKLFITSWVLIMFGAGLALILFTRFPM